MVVFSLYRYQPDALNAAAIPRSLEANSESDRNHADCT